MDDGTTSDYSSGLYDGLVGGVFGANPIASSSGLVSALQSVSSSTKDAVVSSVPAQVVLGVGQFAADGIDATVTGADSLVSALTPSKSTLVLIVVGLIALFLVLGKVDQL